MDYKEKVIALLNSQELSKEQKEKLESIFPELKENEDERIRKELIEFLKSASGGFLNSAVQCETFGEWLAWLEKQGKEEHALKSFKDEDIRKFMQYIEKQAKAYEFNLPNRGYDIYAFAKDILYWLEKQGNKSINIDVESMVSSYEQRLESQGGTKYTPLVNMRLTAFRHGVENVLDELNLKKLEKQDENKHIDKVEPKFKVGDWVLNNVCYPLQIASIKDSMYIFTEGDALSVSFVDEHLHLWSIQDAEDGDVLVDEDNNIGLYLEEKDDVYWHSCIYLGCDNCLRGFSIGGYHKHKNTKPATKEQRDLLFQKMKEAGYEWDSEKKELKKIEQKFADKIEPKFHEDDWIVFNGLILHIDEVINGYYRTTSIGDGIHNSYDWNIDNAARLWTIQDAKDGDVLASEDKDKIFLYNGKLDLRGRACAYCGIYKTYDGLRFAKCTVGNYFTYKEPYPTTKEQRDTLFAKMADAGYEWDANKKELKKMEEVSKESEDERIRKAIIRILKGETGYTSKEDTDKYVTWLEKQKGD